MYYGAAGDYYTNDGVLVSWTLQLYGHQPTEKYLNFYLDGVRVKNRRLNGTMAINTRAGDGGIRLGASIRSEVTLDGAVDDIYVYDRTLNPDEINILYQDMKASPTSLSLIHI